MSDWPFPRERDRRFAMTKPSTPTPRAAGAFIALGLIIGPLIGIGFGQPTIGLLAGFGVGMIIAIGQWLFDRAR